MRTLPCGEHDFELNDEGSIIAKVVVDEDGLAEVAEVFDWNGGEPHPRWWTVATDHLTDNFENKVVEAK